MQCSSLTENIQNGKALKQIRIESKPYMMMTGSSLMCPEMKMIQTGQLLKMKQIQGVREKARVFETLNFFGKGLTQIETDVQLL